MWACNPHPSPMATVASVDGDGLRRVAPYYDTLCVFAKGRWVGAGLVDALSSEFPRDSRAYYEWAVRVGRVTVDGQRVNDGHVLAHGERIEHVVHRHEPPVSAEPIEVLAETSDFVVINKPSSVPVHPCGQFRINTVLGILATQHPEYAELKTVHRLDRLTGGILLLARNVDAARRFERNMQMGLIGKEYVCRVVGVFPGGNGEAVECREPIAEGWATHQRCRIDAAGREARTTFERIATDGVHSIVRCTPHTGRMHQIRIHLEHLGFPIANDPVYGRPGATREFVQKVVDWPPAPPFPDNGDYRSVPDPMCRECHTLRPKPTEYLWLHAVRYWGPGFAFECGMPPWCLNLEQQNRCAPESVPAPDTSGPS